MHVKENLKDFEDLKSAVGLLESPSLIARISHLIGSPIEDALRKMPASISKKISKAAEAALHKAATAALWSLDGKLEKPASTKLHKLYAATSGAIGGAFGFTALFIELPISTTIMMRAVADVAQSEGFDLQDFSTKHACVEVFAMGGNTKKDDSAETGYYAFRGLAAKSLSHLSKELTELVARRGPEATTKISTEQVGKWIAELIEKVASRFGIIITNKFAAQIVPIIGAATGSALNILFTDYYQDIARGHFIVKRLEAKYGFDHIQAVYSEILRDGWMYTV